MSDPVSSWRCTAKRDLKLVQALNRLNSFDIILVDELGGYVDLNQGEVDVLFSFFGERYEKQRSVFVTTNLAFGEWDKVFNNPMTATAIVDRLVHRCVLLEFPAKRSIREEEAKKTAGVNLIDRNQCPFAPPTGSAFSLLPIVGKSDRRIFAGKFAELASENVDYFFSRFEVPVETDIKLFPGHPIQRFPINGNEVKPFA